MSRIARTLAAGTTLCLALLMMIGNAKARFFDEDASFKKDLETLVTLLKSDKVDQAKVKTLVAAIQKKNDDLNDLMAIYKPTKSKGLGWNPAVKGTGDGIEKHIIDLGTKKELTKEQLSKEKDHIVRAAYYNLAMHEILEAFIPPVRPGGRNPAKWHDPNAEVKVFLEEWVKRVKAFRIDTGEEIETRSGHVWSPTALPLAWSA